MPLQIRRGPTADRLAITPLQGELVYDTTTGAVYIGNGTTAGGVPVTSFSVADARTTTAKMFLGESLSDNSVHSGISFQLVGNRLNATVVPDLSAYPGLITAGAGFKGNVWADDSGLIVNSETHTVYGNFVAQGNILPDTNLVYDIGSSSQRFKDIYLSGSSIHLGNAVITAVDAAIDLPAGSTIGGQPAGLNEGDTYNIIVTGNVIGLDSTVMVNTSTGTFHGDLIGSVFADDSSILVDGRDGVLRGTLIGTLQGDAFGTLYGTATSATVASSVTLTPTNTSASTHYLAFYDDVTGNENTRTDSSLTYVPLTNTLTAGTFSGELVGNVFTSTIDTSDSSAITVVPSVVFNSDVTIENELSIENNLLPTTSEVVNLGSYTKKFKQLYLTEGANAIWIGNAVIGGSGSTVNLPAGSTIGGSSISAIVGGTNYNIGITANDTTVMVNTATKVITAAGGFVGNVTGQVSDISNHTIRWSITAEDSTVTNVTNLSTLKVLGENGISTRLIGGDLYVGVAEITEVSPVIQTDSTPRYVPFVENTSTSSRIGSSTTLRYIPSTGQLESTIFSGSSIQVSNTVSTPVVTYATDALFLTSSFNDGTILSNTIQVGTNTTDGRFAVQIGSYISGSNPWINFRQIHDTVDANNIIIGRARGTPASPSAITTGDDVIDISFSGYSGGTYRTAALLNVAAEGTITGSAVPGKVTLQTANSSGTLTTALTVNSKQESAFNGPMILKSYADTTARDAAITSPSAGMLIYLTSTNKAQVYNGSGWVDLH